ncbi:multisubunit sodium/proton antiporter, MrpB subunit [Limimonas halophila]|uniref:Multisubunit sodium/proton antiporter, MrpB subunit n=1 Tax=Limimonas halophila TaxID=1082479 RepID=A0A1G7NT43_9PROT|nr:Na+/H+ antiporter subunit B [Limimonas halophila]SDF77131.1 multisubunit sodium/proton antiporter, MrpB subunit [Limimonas halophila]
MHSIILHTATRLLMSLILMFSVYILFRGHNQPGGGFIAGLIAASAVILYSVAFGPQWARDALRVPALSIAGFGLFVAALSGVLSLIGGEPFLTGLWYEPHLGLSMHVALSTPLMFDIGVYLVVVGALTAIALELEEASA